MTGAAVVTGGAAVVAVATVLVVTVGDCVVTAVVTVVCRVVNVATVTVVAGLGVQTFLVVVATTPEVVAEGLGALVFPVGFTVTLPGEVTGGGRAVLEIAVVAAAVVVVVLVVAVPGVRAVLGEGEVTADMVGFEFCVVIPAVLGLPAVMFGFAVG